MTSGSIEGAGNYVLGANTLTTGSLNTSTQVDGVISGTGGGLTKVGTGTLTLTNVNTYTGATTISAGTLALSGFGASRRSSVVTVNATFDISAITASFAADHDARRQFERRRQHGQQRAVHHQRLDRVRRRDPGHRRAGGLRRNANAVAA